MEQNQDDVILPPVRYVKRRRQKYLRLRVRAEEIIVSAPQHATKRDMQAFFEEKYDWVKQQCRRLRKRKETVLAQNRFPEGYLYHEGEWKPVALHHHATAADRQPSVQFDETAGRFDIFLADPSRLPGEAINYESPAIAALARQAYAGWAAGIIGPRFVEKAAQLKFRHNKVTIRSQQTRWGSCSSKGNISLNWRLIKAPRFVQDYIFVHEMCHLVHLNHSPKYWALVDSYFPRRPEAEQWLRDHGPIAFQQP